MYVFVLLNQDVRLEDEEIQTLHKAYGPYVSSYEAVGAAVDMIRGMYSKEPKFIFQDFGEGFNDTKIIVDSGNEMVLAATVNKCESY